MQSFDDQREGALGGGGTQDKLKMFLKDPKHWERVSDGLVAAQLCAQYILGSVSLHLSRFTFLKEMEELLKQ